MERECSLSIRRQCKLLGINRSSLYQEKAIPDPADVALKEEMMEKIDRWHTEMPAIGSRKIVSLLRKDGYKVGRKLVVRLMREMGIYTIYPKPNLSKRNFKEGILPYLLRNYVVRFPNQVWSIDITFIKFYRGHMYLTAIIDWYSRKIIAWNLADTLETENVLSTVRFAARHYGIPAILNSDQGSQFTSTEYKQLLKDYHIRQSMDGKSRWADNVTIERWFRSLKTELIYIEEFKTPRELRMGISRYIEQYNSERPHQALEYATPDSVYYSSFAA